MAVIEAEVPGVVLEEEPPAPPPSSSLLEEIRADELAQIQDFNGRFSGQAAPKPTAKDFVDYVYNVHRSWIERWGGWRRRFEPFALTALRGNDTTRVIDAIFPPQPSYGYSAVPEPRGVRGYYTTFQSKLATADGPVTYAEGRTLTIRRGQSVSRKILADVRQNYPGELAKWEKLFERLGQEWASSKPLQVMVSCAPSDFLWLGHYGDNTCYSNTHSHSKWHLAQVPGSFVLLVFEGEMPETFTARNRPKILGRAWGVLTPHGAILNNIYKMEWTRVLPAVRAAFGAELGTESLSQTVDSHTANAFSELSAAPMYVDKKATQISIKGHEREVATAAKAAAVHFRNNGVKYCG